MPTALSVKTNSMNLNSIVVRLGTQKTQNQRASVGVRINTKLKSLVLAKFTFSSVSLSPFLIVPTPFCSCKVPPPRPASPRSPASLFFLGSSFQLF